MARALRSRLVRTTRGARRVAATTAWLKEPRAGAEAIDEETVTQRGAVHVEERLPVAAGSPRLARRAAERALASAVSADRMDAVVLAISEIVTNAIVHAGMRPDDEIVITLDDADQRIRVEVQDSGSGFLPGSDGKSLRDEGGHGLRLVEEIADAWGVEQGPPTRVWFEVRSPGP